MGFFDFLRDTPRYEGRPERVDRLDSRHRFLVEPYANELAGARVLDLAAHDGRWSYAMSAAGAAFVHAVEPEEDNAAGFAHFPAGPVKDRVRMRVGDVLDLLAREVEAGRRYDVVALLGLLHRTAEHARMLSLVHALSPRLVVVDAAVLPREAPVIRLSEEPAHRAGLEVGPPTVVVGVPSASALELMARTLGYEVSWQDLSGLGDDERAGLEDYFRPAGARVRRTCALRPVTA
jgi:hypothetical protein